VFVNGTNEGLGHETTIVDIVCKELGLKPDEVSVTNQVDTDQPWNLASGSYSSRFAPVIISALILPIENMKKKLITLAKKYLEAEEVAFQNGQFVDVRNPKKSVDVRRLVSAYHLSLLPYAL
jgi:2-furoyl-CoA dehydrogenase large subunit